MHPDIAIVSPHGRGGGASHGGITPVVLALTRAFSEAGRRVDLISFAADDPRLPDLGPRVTPYNLGPGRRRQHRARLALYLAEHGPGALLAAGHRANLLAATLRHPARPGGAPRVVLSVHNALTPGLRDLNPVRRALKRSELRRDYMRADHIVCVSDGVRRDLEGLVPAAARMTSVIHNPIAAPSAEPASPLHPWLAPGEPPVLLGAGRLSRQKDFATLLAAFARLGDTPARRLLIIGEGAERNNLLYLARQLGVAARVDLPGFVPNPRAHMAAAALLVLSSAWEGFGNVLVEAMSVGTPVVATDCESGPREILQDGALGPLVPVGDAAALADAMARTLAAPADPDRLRRRAADFAPQAVAGRYLTRLFPT